MATRSNPELLKNLEADAKWFIEQMKKWREQDEPRVWPQGLKDAITELRLSSRMVKF